MSRLLHILLAATYSCYTLNQVVLLVLHPLPAHAMAPISRTPSPVPAPTTWKPGIAASSVLYSGLADLAAPLPAAHSTLPLYPNYGNGYLGGVLGCFAQDTIGEGPTATAGVVHVGGVFAGKGDASQRAEIPGLFSMYPVSAGGQGVAFGGSALDLEAGTFTNRTVLMGCGAILEQRWYAHRAIRSLLVYEVELLPSPSPSLSASPSPSPSPPQPSSSSCTIVFASCNGDPTSTKTTVVSNTTSPDNGTVVSSLSVTIDTETTNTSLVTVARVFQQPPSTLTLTLGAAAKSQPQQLQPQPQPQPQQPQHRVPANYSQRQQHNHSGHHPQYHDQPQPQHQQQQQYLAVLTTSLAEEGADAASDPLAAATALFASSGAVSPSSLRKQHEAAWAALHASRIELAGDAGDATARAVAAAVNSSMFYLLSAAREDWPFSTSPGGLANNAYEGHT